LLQGEGEYFWTTEGGEGKRKKRLENRSKTCGGEKTIPAMKIPFPTFGETKERLAVVHYTGERDEERSRKRSNSGRRHGVKNGKGGTYLIKTEGKTGKKKREITTGHRKKRGRGKIRQKRSLNTPLRKKKRTSS